MDVYQVIDRAFDLLHILWALMIFFTMVMSIARHGVWSKIYFVVIGTTIVGQLIWMYCPLVVIQNAIWNYGHPEDRRATGSITARFVEAHLGLAISPWMVTATLIGLFILTAWLAFRRRR